MQGKTKERWLQLAELVAKEQDPEKLLALMVELNQLLEEKQNRLQHNNPPAK